MIFFKHNFEIRSDIPVYKLVRQLEENINTEKKFLWPWQKRNPFSGSITGNGFKVTKNSFLNNYKSVVCGKFKVHQKHTLVVIQIKQTSLFYLAILFGIFFLSGGFLLIEGANLENIIVCTVVAAIYYSICLFFFIIDTKSTMKKIKKIIAGDNS